GHRGGAALTPATRHARWAVLAVFVVNGLLYGSFASRIPAIRDRIGLSNGELGLALAFVAVGSIAAMPPAGAAAARGGRPPRLARWAVLAVFVVNGLLYGSFASRIPAIRDRIGLSNGELGLALAFVAVGSIAAMPLAGAAAARVGSRRATRVSLALACLATGV